MDRLAELDRIITETDETARTLPSPKPAEGAGDRLVRNLIASGAIKDSVDARALYKAVVDAHYSRFLVRQGQAEKIVESLRQEELNERSKTALVDQLQRLDHEMEEMVMALEDLAAYG